MDFGLKALTLQGFDNEDFVVKDFGSVLEWALREKMTVPGLNARKMEKTVLGLGTRAVLIKKRIKKRRNKEIKRKQFFRGSGP